jgi:hypothetical protein
MMFFCVAGLRWTALRGPAQANLVALFLAATSSLFYHVSLRADALMLDIASVTMVVFVFTLTTLAGVLDQVRLIPLSITFWCLLTVLGFNAASCEGSFRGFPDSWCHFFFGEIVVIGSSLPFGLYALNQARKLANSIVQPPSPVAAILAVLLHRARLFGLAASLCLLGDRLQFEWLRQVCEMCRLHAFWHVFIGLAGYYLIAYVSVVHEVRVSRHQHQVLSSIHLQPRVFGLLCEVRTGFLASQTEGKKINKIN